MLKILAAGTAIVAIATGVSRVSMTKDDVRIGDRPVTEAVLQLRDTGNGQVLASNGIIESLGGDVEIGFEGDRSVTIEPGVRLSRVEDGWKLSTHGRRTLTLTSGTSTMSVESPALLGAKDGGWMIGGASLDGAALRVAVAHEIRVTEGSVRVAAEGDGADGSGDTAPKTNRSRRLFVEDPLLNSRGADEEALKRDADVSETGTR